VAFHGPVEGRLVLSISGNVLPSMVANMLGEEGAPGPEVMEDALGELANVICGNVLPGIAGGQETFHLDPPRPMAVGGASPSAEVHVGLGPGRADVLLFVKQGRPDGASREREPGPSRGAEREGGPRS
jgi:hypothetical protein